MENAPTANSDPERILPLEERKLAREAAERRWELSLKEREVAIKEVELRRSRWLNPTAIGLAAAAIGLIGNVVVTSINNKNAQQLERSRMQSNIVVQAISTGTINSACTNLVAFVDFGLLDDPHGAIRNCLKSPNTTPVLPGNQTVRSESGDHYRYQVSLTVPQAPDAVRDFSFNLISVYAYKVDAMNQRSQDISLDPVHGSWKPGDHVSFSIDLPKQYVDDPKHEIYIRYCIGSVMACMPSENLNGNFRFPKQ